jgi:hypothetical protein
MRLMRVPIRSVVATACAAVVFLSGCKPDEDIRAYTAPKENTAKAEKPVADEKYRMLAAIIPADEKYFWSVKLTGPTEVVSPLEADFNTFVKSIKPGADSNAPPSLTPPAGWEEGPPGAMRLTTFKKNGVEMVLSTPVGGSHIENVNRWRKQLGLRELKTAEFAGSLTEIKVADKTAYTVDLRGPSWSGGMAGGKGPFQK